MIQTFTEPQLGNRPSVQLDHVNQVVELSYFYLPEPSLYRSKRSLSCTWTNLSNQKSCPWGLLSWWHPVRCCWILLHPPLLQAAACDRQKNLGEQNDLVIHSCLKVRLSSCFGATSKCLGFQRVKVNLSCHLLQSLHCFQVLRSQGIIVYGLIWTNELTLMCKIWAYLVEKINSVRIYDWLFYSKEISNIIFTFLTDWQHKG